MPKRTHNSAKSAKSGTGQTFLEKQKEKMTPKPNSNISGNLDPDQLELPTERTTTLDNDDLLSKSATKYKFGDISSMPSIVKSPYENNESAEVGEPLFDSLKQLLLPKEIANGGELQSLNGTPTVTVQSEANAFLGWSLAEQLVHASRAIAKSGICFSPNWLGGRIREYQYTDLPATNLLLCLQEQRFVRASPAILSTLVKDAGVDKIFFEAIEEWELEDMCLPVFSSPSLTFTKQRRECYKCVLFVARAYQYSKTLKRSQLDDTVMTKVKQCLMILNKNTKVDTKKLAQLKETRVVERREKSAKNKDLPAHGTKPPRVEGVAGGLSYGSQSGTSGSRVLSPVEVNPSKGPKKRVSEDFDRANRKRRKLVMESEVASATGASDIAQKRDDRKDEPANSEQDQACQTAQLTLAQAKSQSGSTLSNTTSKSKRKRGDDGEKSDAQQSLPSTNRTTTQQETNNSAPIAAKQLQAKGSRVNQSHRRSGRPTKNATTANKTTDAQPGSSSPTNKAKRKPLPLPTNAPQADNSKSTQSDHVALKTTCASRVPASKAAPPNTHTSKTTIPPSSSSPLDFSKEKSSGGTASLSTTTGSTNTSPGQKAPQNTVSTSTSSSVDPSTEKSARDNTSLKASDTNQVHTNTIGKAVGVAPSVAVDSNPGKGTSPDTTNRRKMRAKQSQITGDVAPGTLREKQAEETTPLKRSDCKFGAIISMLTIVKSPYEPSQSAEVGEPLFDKLKFYLSSQEEEEHGGQLRYFEGAPTLTPQPAAEKLFGEHLAQSLVHTSHAIAQSGMVFSPAWLEGKIREVRCGWVPKPILLLCLQEQRFTRASDTILASIIRDLGVSKILSNALQDWRLDDGENLRLLSNPALSFHRQKRECYKCVLFVARAYRCSIALKRTKLDDSLVMKIKACLTILRENVKVHPKRLTELEAQSAKRQMIEARRKQAMVAAATAANLRRQAATPPESIVIAKRTNRVSTNASIASQNPSVAVESSVISNKDSSIQKRELERQERDESLTALLEVFEEQYRSLGDTLNALRRQIKSNREQTAREIREEVRAELLHEQHNV